MESSRKERKIVTVLFADLVGFTARAEQLDPEDVEAILRPYHERLRSELERFGGTVEKFIGDAVMALFGAPVAHEDDPERAVRAALAIRDWIEEDGTLEVRIAINTGEALVSLHARPEAGEGMASGDVINTAARLQAAAPVNGILVGETTQRASRHVIDYREIAPVTAKGKVEPSRVWEAVQARSRLGVDLLRGVRSPLVGRERELSLLRDTLLRVREGRSPQLVTLVGVPGIGKSRMVYELMQHVASRPELVIWRQGRSLPYGEGVTYWALSEMVKAQAGVLETDSAEDAHRKLQRAVGDVITDESAAEWVETHLRPLAGVSAETEPGADRRSEAFTAWRRFFEALAETRPLVLVFEDIHWADDGLLDFVDHLVEWASGVPILVVCTSRPELLDRRSNWGGGKLNATTLSISPLSDEETAHLLAALLQQPLLPADAQTSLLARAGGNPLYAEQYAQMQAERPGSSDLPVPESVQGIIAARLDLLPPEEKGLLQDAAVLGKVFWLGGLADGRPRTVSEERLHALERKGFVERARQSSVAEEAEYAFRHVLVRDVAYGQIPRADRAEKHRRAAEWIESLGRPEDHAEMLAHHYLAALEFARAAGQKTETFADSARSALREAGDRAFSLSAYSAAARFYAAALELSAPDSLEHARLLFALGRTRAMGEAAGVDVLLEAAAGLIGSGDNETAAEAETLVYDLVYRRGDRDQATEHLDRAHALVEHMEVSPAKARVIGTVARFLMIASEYDEAISVGRQALAMAEQLGLADLQAHALDVIGAARAHSGDRGGFEDLDRSVELAAEVNAPHELCRALNNLGSALSTWGELGRSTECFLRVQQVAERFGQATWLRWTRPAIFDSAYWRGDWDEALQGVEKEIRLVEEGSPHYNAIYCYCTRSRIRLARGDLPGASGDAETAVELARVAKDPQVLYGALAISGYVALTGETADVAQARADELIRSVKSAGHPEVVGDALLMLASVLLDLGRADQLAELLPAASPFRWMTAARALAAGDFLRAAEICAEIGSKPDEAHVRLRAAGQLVEQGRRGEADQQLQTALAFYRSVGATRYIREGEALLAATA
jgi:class 3 adenylate cyclase/tetratricopeptide (TPR) repeat protein